MPHVIFMTRDTVTKSYRLCIPNPPLNSLEGNRFEERIRTFKTARFLFSYAYLMSDIFEDNHDRFHEKKK